ncbi:MAG: flagellar export chaperone FliS [Leptospiraceae bacterium]|nr:flagellar export chaperone FliS [Leptospiraceae bacterium]
MSLSKRTGYTSTSDAYKSNEISTVSQAKLIVMLYDGAIRFLDIALEHIKNPKRYDVVSSNLIKVGDIISELMVSLNLDEGGKIANDLLAIYVYLKKRLIEANIEKDEKIVREIKKHLVELKTAWEEIEKKEGNSQTVMPKSGGLSIQG